MTRHVALAILLASILSGPSGGGTAGRAAVVLAVSSVPAWTMRPVLRLAASDAAVCAIIERDMTVGQPRGRVASSVAALGLACSLACGEVKDRGGTMVDAAEQEGEPDAIGAIDASPARCRPESPFGGPVALDAVNSSEELNDEAAALSADELTLYFSSDRAGDYDLYFATREEPDGEFSPPEPVPGLSEPTRLERRPAISADGRQLFSQIGSNADLEIWVATRANTGEPFEELMSAPGLNSDTANDYTPYAVGGGNSLYFASNRESGETTSDIWRATWNGTAFDAPAKVAGADLVTASEESNPVVTPDELTLFFDSNRVDELDIYVATRTSTDDDFGPAALLADLSSADLDAPNWISADGCVLYLTQRVGPSRTYKIFVARRSP